MNNSINFKYFGNSFCNVGSKQLSQSLTYFQVNRSSPRSTDFDFYPWDFMMCKAKTIEFRRTIMMVKHA